MKPGLQGLLAAFIFLGTIWADFSLASSDSSETITVAVASNFILPMRVISNEYEAKTGVQINLSSGSSGKLYAQIVNGAPYDFFLSADQEKPVALEQDDLAIPDSRYTYALGRLVLLHMPEGPLVPEGPLRFSDKQKPIDHLRELATGEKLALANPQLAPFGLAAVEVLKNLGLYDQVKDQIVYGENVSQAYQFFESGNAALGLVALSQIGPEQVVIRQDFAWLVPDSLHSPIRQDMVLLKKGAENQAAIAFYDWLKTEEAQELIVSFGYDLDVAESDW